MKLNSPLFDKIRVKPDKDRRLQTELPACEWAGCKNGATHRAPKGRGRENDYQRFCLDHVREFNHSYNFFKDMTADAVASYQKDSLTGHRPTWKLGAMGGVGRKPRVTRARRVAREARTIRSVYSDGPARRVRRRKPAAKNGS